MMYINRGLMTLAKDELIRKDIHGNVTNVVLIYKSGVSMIRITFVTNTKPNPTLTRHEYMEYDDEHYHLYIPLDTPIFVLQK